MSRFRRPLRADDPRDPQVTATILIPDEIPGDVMALRVTFDTHNLDAVCRPKSVPEDPRQTAMHKVHKRAHTGPDRGVLLGDDAHHRGHHAQGSGRRFRRYAHGDAAGNHRIYEERRSARDSSGAGGRRGRGRRSVRRSMSSSRTEKPFRPETAARGAGGEGPSVSRY